MRLNRDFLLAVSLLAGTIIGAGIFSLPYFFNLLGLFWGIVYLIFFMFFYYFVHLMYLKVLSLEKEEHQIFYLLHKYFSFKKANFISFLIFLELIFVMLVYLVLAPIFLNIIFKNSNFLFLVLLFWLFSSIFIFLKIKFLGYADLLGIFSIFIIIFSLLIYGFNKPLFLNFFNKIELEHFFLPLGPILFSFAGRPALNKVYEIYKTKRNFSLKMAVFCGTFLPLLVYLTFVFSVLKINSQPSPEVLNSLFFCLIILLFF